MSLQGKVAFVTGDGRAIAQRLVHEGTTGSLVCHPIRWIAKQISSDRIMAYSSLGPSERGLFYLYGLDQITCV